MRAFQLLIVLALSSALHADDPPHLTVGLREKLLFKSAGLFLKDVPSLTTDLGVNYEIFDIPTAPSVITRVFLAVHPSVEAAAAQRSEVSRWMALALDHADVALNIGDDRRVISGNLDGGGTIWVRRGNVTITLVWARNSQRPLQVMEKLDIAIRDNREIAPVGLLREQPDILSTGIANPLTISEGQLVAPTTVGLGPANDVRYYVEDAGGLAKVEQRDSKFYVTKYQPKPDRPAELALASEPAKICVYAAGRLNLFTSKTFTLSVAP
ncbi:MAG: hypothetical protein SF069_02620 [Phycisphaerae bacterium]|nr:hypothetical protein [Phycisphaerae bacterium]